MIYDDLHTSLLRFCQTFAESQDQEMEFRNFDSSWSEDELPPLDVVGTLGLSFEFNDHLIDGSLQIGVTTLQDKNLFRLTSIVSKLLESLRPTNKLTIYSAETGAKIGLLVIRNGTRVMPVAGSKTRPVQFIAVNFSTTVTYQLPGEVI